MPAINLFSAIIHATSLVNHFSFINTISIDFILWRMGAIKIYTFLLGNYILHHVKSVINEFDLHMCFEPPMCVITSRCDVRAFPLRAKTKSVWITNINILIGWYIYAWRRKKNSMPVYPILFHYADVCYSKTWKIQYFVGRSNYDNSLFIGTYPINTYIYTKLCVTVRSDQSYRNFLSINENWEHM